MSIERLLSGTFGIFIAIRLDDIKSTTIFEAQKSLISTFLLNRPRKHCTAQFSCRHTILITIPLQTNQKVTFYHW